MRTPETVRAKIFIVGSVAAVTIFIHYGWFEPFLGHSHWVHAIHGRLCYIPIVIAASWFGVRGGVYTASVISILVLPFILNTVKEPHALANAVTEVVFYFALGILIGILTDREARGRKKQEEAQTRAERSQKLSLVGQLAAGVAHEIKNPLASIKGATDILIDPDTSHSDREEFKNILQREVRRIDATVTEFLEFARPRETTKEKLNLTESLRTSLRQLKPQAKQQGTSIQAEMEEGIIVNGDAEKLHQMTLNLILNAIHASQGAGAVVVTLQTQNNMAAQLTFSDSGTGISSDELAHVFDPFFTTKASGTGLGLTVVKDIVENHQGSIKIDSSETEGTTVTISLPLYKE